MVDFEGSEILGFDFKTVTNVSPHFCSLPSIHFRKMKEYFAYIPLLIFRHGIPLDEDGEGEGDGEEDYELTVTAYVDLWLSVASLGKSIC